MPGPAVVDLDYRRFDLCCLALSCQVSMTICQNCRRWSFDFACLLLMISISLLFEPRADSRLFKQHSKMHSPGTLLLWLFAPDNAICP